LALQLNGSFGLINQKLQSEKPKPIGLNNQPPPPPETDFSAMVKNSFAHMMSNIVTVRAFLEKYGYGKYWATWDIKDLYATYTILKTKNFE